MRRFTGGSFWLVVCAVVLAMVAGACGFGPSSDAGEEADALDRRVAEHHERTELAKLRDRIAVLSEQSRLEDATPSTGGGSSDVPSPTTTPGGTSVSGTYEGPPSGLTCSDIEPYGLYTFTLAGGTVTIEAGGQTQAAGTVASDGSFTIEAADVGISVTGRADGSSLTAEFSAAIDGCAFTVIADRVD